MWILFSTYLACVVAVCRNGRRDDDLILQFSRHASYSSPRHEACDIFFRGWNIGSIFTEGDYLDGFFWRGGGVLSGWTMTLMTSRLL